MTLYKVLTHDYRPPLQGGEHGAVLRAFLARRQEGIVHPAMRQVDPHPGQSTLTAIADLWAEGWLHDSRTGVRQFRSLSLRDDQAMKPEVVARYLPRSCWPLTGSLGTIRLYGGRLHFEISEIAEHVGGHSP